MKQKAKALKYKIPMALRGIAGVFKMPRYAVFALALAFVFAALIYFTINMNFYGPLFVSRLPLGDKLGVAGTMLGAMTGGFFTTFDGLMLCTVSVLQGIAFAVMIYTMRRNKRMDAKTLSGGTIAMIAAALGLGCVPCGTSLILPIVTLFFSSGAYAAANTASLIVLAIALLLSVYSIYRLGYIAYAHVESDKHSKKEEHSEE